MTDMIRRWTSQVQRSRLLSQPLIQWLLVSGAFLALASLFYARSFGAFFISDDIDTYGGMAQAIKNGDLLQFMFQPFNQHVLVISKIPYLINFLAGRQIFAWHVFLLIMLSITCTALYFFFKTLWGRTHLAALSALLYFFALANIDALYDTYSSCNTITSALIAISILLWLRYLREERRPLLYLSILFGSLASFAFSPGLFVWGLFLLIAFREREAKLLRYLVPVLLAGGCLSLILIIKSSYPVVGDELQSDVLKGLSFTWKGTDTIALSFLTSSLQRWMLLLVAIVLMITRRTNTRGLLAALFILFIPLWITLTARSNFTESYLWIRYYYLPQLGLCLLAGELLQGPWKSSFKLSPRIGTVISTAVLVPMVLLSAAENSRLQTSDWIDSLLSLSTAVISQEQTYRQAVYRYTEFYDTHTVIVPAAGMQIPEYPKTPSLKFYLNYILPYGDHLTVTEGTGSDFYRFLQP